MNAGYESESVQCGHGSLGPPWALIPRSHWPPWFEPSYSVTGPTHVRHPAPDQARPQHPQITERRNLPRTAHRENTTQRTNASQYGSAHLAPHLAQRVRATLLDGFQPAASPIPPRAPHRRRPGCPRCMFSVLIAVILLTSQRPSPSSSPPTSYACK